MNVATITADTSNASYTRVVSALTQGSLDVTITAYLESAMDTPGQFADYDVILLSRLTDGASGKATTAARVAGLMAIGVPIGWSLMEAGFSTGVSGYTDSAAVVLGLAASLEVPPSSASDWPESLVAHDSPLPDWARPISNLFGFVAAANTPAGDTWTTITAAGVTGASTFAVEAGTELASITTTARVAMSNLLYQSNAAPTSVQLALTELLAWLTGYSPSPAAPTVPTVGQIWPRGNQIQR